MWLTPAGAGNTFCLSSSVSPSPAYPRRCGEHHVPARHWNGTEGLPPQVRGTHRLRFWVVLWVGLTPAGAGNTCWAAAVQANVVGLPPQVRGTPGHWRVGDSRGGLTPAGAGNTQRSEQSKKLNHGLPPQVRGTRTPARISAGESKAYPRRCGEHPHTASQNREPPGLPPQVRGTLERANRIITAYRLTPAGAGNTPTAPAAG